MSSWCMYNTYKYVQYGKRRPVHIHMYFEVRIRLYAQWCTHLVRMIRPKTYNTETVQYLQNSS